MGEVSPRLVLVLMGPYSSPSRHDVKAIMMRSR
jgi:hypothetical protein